MKSLALVLAVACCCSGPVLAEVSLVRPMPRPDRAVPVQEPAAMPDLGAAMLRSIRPLPRPESIQMANVAPKPGLLGKLFGPKKVIAKKPAAKAPKQYASGSVCNDSAIQGTAIPSIRGALKGCGVENPVRITAVDGVTLSTPATVDCNTARALRKWMTNKVQPAFGANEVVGLQVAAHYACRGRNNKKGARISEHGRGKAIDISGFKLADGSELTVLQDYKTRAGKPMRVAHQAACGIFGTTLGPGSDGYHENHLHLDTAKYRSGPYCK